MTDGDQLDAERSLVRALQERQLQDRERKGSEDKALAELEAQNKDLLDKVNEREFLLVFTVFMLIDVLLFEKFAESSTIIVVFALFQLGCLIVMAPRFGIQEVGRLINRTIEAWGRKNGQ